MDVLSHVPRRLWTSAVHHHQDEEGTKGAECFSLARRSSMGFKAVAYVRIHCYTVRSYHMISYDMMIPLKNISTLDLQL